MFLSHKQILLSILGFALALATGANSAIGQVKVAFLVGVEKYEKDGFDFLNYAEDDAQALKA